MFTVSTIYGGGGNDTVTFSAASMTASVVSLNKGADKFVLNSGATVKDSTIGLGADGDNFTMIASGQVLSSQINLGKGNDSTYFGGMQHSGDFAFTTLNGGAGADLLLASSTDIFTDETAEIVLEYLNNSESTLSAYDTIAINAGSNVEGFYTFRYEPVHPKPPSRCWLDWY